jgi:hypothetical protein
MRMFLGDWMCQCMVIPCAPAVCMHCVAHALCIPLLLSSCPTMTTCLTVVSETMFCAWHVSIQKRASRKMYTHIEHQAGDKLTPDM